jgi:hypothetical protein
VLALGTILQAMLQGILQGAGPVGCCRKVFTSVLYWTFCCWVHQWISEFVTQYWFSMYYRSSNIQSLIAIFLFPMFPLIQEKSEKQWLVTLRMFCVLQYIETQLCATNSVNHWWVLDPRSWIFVFERFILRYFVPIFCTWILVLRRLFLVVSFLGPSFWVFAQIFLNLRVL